jgi:uncharacterized protein
MRIPAILLMAVMALAFAAPLRAEESKPAAAADPARIAAARDLMEVTGVSKQLDGMMDAMKQGVERGANAAGGGNGKKAGEDFDSFKTKFLTYKEEMLNDFAGLYAETFTADEMKQVADFYRSGTGAKFIQMTPALMQKGAVIGMKYSERIINDMKDKAPK